MHEAYKAATLKYPKLSFGYKDNHLYYDMSVMTKNFRLVKVQKQIPYGQSAQAYGSIYVQLIKDLIEEAKDKKAVGQGSR